MPEESIDIRVGTGDHAKVFHISKYLICNICDYFEKECVSGSSNQIQLSEDDPVVFGLFFQWAHGQDIHDYSRHSNEPWLSNAAASWVLARKL